MFLWKWCQYLNIVMMRQTKSLVHFDMFHTYLKLFFERENLSSRISRFLWTSCLKESNRREWLSLWCYRLVSKFFLMLPKMVAILWLWVSTEETCVKKKNPWQSVLYQLVNLVLETKFFDFIFSKYLNVKVRHMVMSFREPICENGYLLFLRDLIMLKGHHHDSHFPD